MDMFPIHLYTIIPIGKVASNWFLFRFWSDSFTGHNWWLYELHFIFYACGTWCLVRTLQMPFNKPFIGMEINIDSRFLSNSKEIPHSNWLLGFSLQKKLLWPSDTLNTNNVIHIFIQLLFIKILVLMVPIRKNLHLLKSAEEIRRDLGMRFFKKILLTTHIWNAQRKTNNRTYTVTMSSTAFFPLGVSFSV